MIKFKSRSEEKIRRTNSRNQRASDERADAKKDEAANTARLRALRLAAAADGDATKDAETENQVKGDTKPPATPQEKAPILPVAHRR